MKTIKATIIAIFIILFSLVGVANALTIDPGEVIPGNSWGLYPWSVAGTGVNGIEAFIINDVGSENTDFELGAGFSLTDGDGLALFSEAGWNGSIINPDYALATGPSNIVNPFQFATLFTGNPANQNFALDLLIYVPGGLAGTARLGWNGQEIVSLNWEPFDYDRTPIPEPATMLLLGTGLVGVAGATRRRKKNQA